MTNAEQVRDLRRKLIESVPPSERTDATIRLCRVLADAVWEAGWRPARAAADLRAEVDDGFPDEHSSVIDRRTRRYAPGIPSLTDADYEPPAARSEGSDG